MVIVPGRSVLAHRRRHGMPITVVSKVVMLSRMNQAIAQRPSPLLRCFQRVDDRGDLHEVGPCSGDEIDAFYHVVWLVPVSLGRWLLRLFLLAHVPARMAKCLCHQ